jgi:hypothetical protein
MALAPKVSDYPKIRKALKFYKVTSIITGIMLLFVLIEMVAKYAFGVEIYAFTPQGTFSLVRVDAFGDTNSEGLNLSSGILIVHGWFYVIYLFSSFLLWSPMRWPFWRFLVLASGGLVPFWSFFLEVIVAKDVEKTLSASEAAELAPLEASH